ncbi:hypothetical protein H8959_018911 [Pygathrix nigripes]
MSMREPPLQGRIGAAVPQGRAGMVWEGTAECFLFGFCTHLHVLKKPQGALRLRQGPIPSRASGALCRVQGSRSFEGETSGPKGSFPKKPLVATLLTDPDPILPDLLDPLMGFAGSPAAHTCRQDAVINELRAAALQKTSQDVQSHPNSIVPILPTHLIKT